MPATLRQKLMAEFIGTFFLMLTIPLAVDHAGGFAPLAVGGVLVVMVFAGAHISGAHYNPAVSVAVLLRGLMTVREMAAYWGAQLVGAVLASLIALVLSARGDAAPIEIWPAFLAEVLFTFALVWVILNVATSPGTDGNSFYGLAIGFTVMAGSFAVGAISGAAFNPAVAIGATIAGLFDVGVIWVYLVACPLGAALAALVFGSASPDPEDASVVR